MSDRIDQQVDLEPEVRKAVQDWSARQERVLTGHPDSDALLAYQEDWLGESEQAEVGDHVALCEVCQQDLLALEAFDAEVPEVSVQLPSELDTRRSWQRFEQARAREKEGPSAIAGGSGWRHWGGWIAALMVLAMGAMVLSKGSNINAPKPMPESGALAALGSPFVFGLTPNGTSVQRGAESLRKVEVPAGTGPLVPTMIMGDLTAYGRYFVEVYGEDDRRLLQRQGLARDHQGRITFFVERCSWPAGVWTVRLFAASGSDSAGSNIDPPMPIELAAYSLRLQYAE